MNELRINAASGCALLWLLALSYLCLSPMPAPALEVPYLDKLQHFLFFALAGVWLGLLPLSRRCAKFAEFNRTIPW